MPDYLPHISKKKRPRNKPRDDAWLQQKLRAYRPVYTFRCALPGVLISSFLCIGTSIVLYKNSLEAFEYPIDYTDCYAWGSQGENQSRYEGGQLTCTVQFKLQEVKGEVIFYYGLRNFYQNIRKYEQSRNDRQLAGKLQNTEDCSPYDTVTRQSDRKILPIVPCGAIANSMFNDTFFLSYKTASKLVLYQEREVPMTTQNLMHNDFRKHKYKNPQLCHEENITCPGFEDTARPMWWRKGIENLGDRDTGRALENFDFIQWMETAALPNFKKLYRRLLQQPGDLFYSGLPTGDYTLTVKYNYNVSVWGGRKLFIIQADGPIGPRAMFQAWAYFALGLFLFALGGFMLIIEFSPCLADSLRSMFDSCRPPDLAP